MRTGRLNKMRKNVYSPALLRGAHASRPFRDWGLHAPSGQRKYLTPHERRRFIAAARRQPPSLQTFCLTLAYTGCRLSEALALTAGDIEIEDGLVSIRCLKKRGRLVVRQVPVPPAFLQLLERMHSDAFRPEALTRRLWRWRRTRAWQLVKEVMRAAQIYQTAASPKGLRHTFGTHAILSGV
ncbi:MAG: hypothetical protein C3F11_06380, partial [Methylocystaceae bacterium]